MIDALARNPCSRASSRQLGDLEAAMRRKEHAPGHAICHQGEAAESLFVIVDGFARVLVDDRPVATLRRADVVGEMSLVSGEPRSATVVAAVPTTAPEPSRYGVAALIAEHPRILENLTRILSDRLAATTAAWWTPAREEKRLPSSFPQETAGALLDVVAATEAASPRPVATLDVRESLDELEKLDDLLAANGTVLVVADPGRPRPRRQPTAR